MVKNHLKSILSEKCLKRIMLTFGLFCFLLSCGIVQVSGSPSANPSTDDLQQRTITGRVFDSKGTPMPGVNVLVKGTTTGVLTDPSGKYVIPVSPGSVLLFSFIGYEPQEVTVSSQSAIDVTLAECHRARRSCGCGVWNCEEEGSYRICFIGEI